MALLHTLKFLVNERLSAAAEEILVTIGHIVREYEDDALYLKQEIDRRSRILDIYRADILHLSLCKEVFYPEQQNMNSTLVQEEPHPPQIKEEQEELLLRPDEGLPLLAVKREDDGENRETAPVTITSAEHMKTQTDVEECARQPTSDSHCSESDTEDSDEWEETKQYQTALNTLESHTAQNMEGQRLPLSENLTQDLKSPKQTKCHTEKKYLDCKDCGKMFNCKGTLKVHTMIHTGEYTFRCTVCGKGCRKISHLKSHMRTHTGEYPFTCTVCGKGCREKSALKTHMMIHTGEMPFTCAVCGKGCRQKNSLETHMRTHTGEKPFACTVCGKGCIHMQHLNNHMMTHTGEKPCTCTVCGKGFGKDSNLKQHMQTHAGERPYICTICGKGYTRRTNLKIHTRNHTLGEQ